MENRNWNCKQTLMDIIKNRCVCCTLALFIVICGFVFLLVIDRTSNGNSQTHTSRSKRLFQGCDDSHTVIDPTVKVCKNSSKCFICQGEIPSAGYIDSRAEMTCEHYNISHDGTLWYLGHSYSKAEIIDSQLYPPVWADKKHRNICCILKGIYAVTDRTCKKDLVYKCFSQYTRPECVCKIQTICEGNGTQKVPCKCFWSLCDFTDQEDLENCSNKAKKPSFKSCIIEYENFKCHCTNEAADENLPQCSTYEKETPYQPETPKGSSGMNLKSSTTCKMISMCVLLIHTFDRSCWQL